MVKAFLYPETLFYSHEEQNEYIAARQKVDEHASAIREAGLECYLSFQLNCSKLNRYYAAIPKDASPAAKHGCFDGIERHASVYPALLEAAMILLTEGGGGPRINPRMQTALAGGGPGEIAMSEPLRVPVSMGVTISEARGEKKPERKVNLSKGESPIWKSFQNYKGEIKTNGKSGKEKQFYTWDNLHNDIEVFDSNRKHMGSMDPRTGELYKPPVAGRTLKQ